MRALHRGDQGRYARSERPDGPACCAATSASARPKVALRAVMEVAFLVGKQAAILPSRRPCSRGQHYLTAMQRFQGHPNQRSSCSNALYKPAAEPTKQLKKLEAGGRSPWSSARTSCSNKMNKVQGPSGLLVVDEEAALRRRVTRRHSRKSAKTWYVSDACRQPPIPRTLTHGAVGIRGYVPSIEEPAV